VARTEGLRPGPDIDGYDLPRLGERGAELVDEAHEGVAIGCRDVLLAQLAAGRVRTFKKYSISNTQIFNLALS
jgi:hypothetical protein